MSRDLSTLTIELPLSFSILCEVRSTIHFLRVLGESPAAIYCQLLEVYSAGCMSVQHVCKWFASLAKDEWKYTVSSKEK